MLLPARRVTTIKLSSHFTWPQIQRFWTLIPGKLKFSFTPFPSPPSLPWGTQDTQELVSTLNTTFLIQCEHAVCWITLVSFYLAYIFLWGYKTASSEFVDNPVGTYCSVLCYCINPFLSVQCRVNSTALLCSLMFNTCRTRRCVHIITNIKIKGTRLVR